MNFTREQIQGMVEGKVTQFRVLKKEGDYIIPKENSFYGKTVEEIEIETHLRDCVNKCFGFPEVLNKARMKYKVGNDYAVCYKGKAVWWCPDCKDIMYRDDKTTTTTPKGYRFYKSLKQWKLEPKKVRDKHLFSCFCTLSNNYTLEEYKKATFRELRYKITAIKEQKQLDATLKVWVISMELIRG